MGKVGRIACIATPMALSLAAWICLILVFLGNWNKSDGNLTSIYFMKVREFGAESNYVSAANSASRPICRNSEVTFPRSRR